jgi:dTDP-4-dehydrorhamnose reductase
MKTRVLLFGGTGTLGKELLKQLDKRKFIVFAPNRFEIDLVNIWSSVDKISDFKPDIIIHAAGFINTEKCEKFPGQAICINTSSICDLVSFVQATIKNTKFIYISSEYVFSGDKGQYTVNDRLDPINVYGKTKAAAEYIVSILPNHQIVRVPFFKKFHPQAYTDQFVSRISVENAAHCIITYILGGTYDENVVHITGERDSVYNHYQKQGVKAEPITIPDHLKNITPKDTSLI